MTTATRRRRDFRDLIRDIRWGVSRVTPFVVFFGGISLIGELLGVQFAGLDIKQTVFIYTFFGLLTGVVVGMLRPIASTIWGAGVIGAIVGVPIALYIRVIALGWNNWRPEESILLVFIVAICAFCAVGFRRGVMRGEAKSRMNQSP